MDQPQDRLPIDVGDEVSGSQARLVGGTPLLHALGETTRSAVPQPETPASCCLSHCLSFPDLVEKGCAEPWTGGREDNPPTVHLLAGAISFMLTEGLCLPVQPCPSCPTLSL